jgi:hypothetical protein
MTKTTTKVNRAECRIGDNVFCLISTVYNQMCRDGFEKEANEMQKKIDSDAESPADVLKICKEYVTFI